MPDWPPELLGYRAYGPLSTAGEGSPAAEAMSNIAALFNVNTAAWGVANNAIFVPVIVQSTTTVYQMGWINGATVAGNVDVGIYDRNANRLVSLGGTAQTGVSVIQVADITDTTLIPGLYYLAMAADDATATYVRGGSSSTASSLLRASGCAMQTTAYPLPTTATMVGLNMAIGIPLLMGATGGAVL